MIRTADRKGNIKKEDSFQNNLLEKIYGSVAGRMMIRPLVTPAVSTVVESFWIPGFRQQQWNRLSGSIIWI